MPDALSLSRTELPEEIEKAIHEFANACLFGMRSADAALVNRNVRNGVDALTAAILSRLGEAQTQIRTQAMEQLAADAGWELDWDRVRAERDAALARVERLESALREVVLRNRAAWPAETRAERMEEAARSALSEAPPQGEQ